MLTILFLGFLIGMQHALEADHIAAVSSVAARQTSLGGVVRHGVAWGAGHSPTLLIFAGATILLDVTASESLAALLELCVGVMLVLLGGHVLARLIRDRIHFHGHGDGTVHFHAHSHRQDPGAHDPKRHAHRHPQPWPVRSLLVGLMHGMAGSAALIILAASVIQSPLLGLAYVALFGLGSIIGMGLLSAVIALPLTYTKGHWYSLI